MNKLSYYYIQPIVNNNTTVLLDIGDEFVLQLNNELLQVQVISQPLDLNYLYARYCNLELLKSGGLSFKTRNVQKIGSNDNDNMLAISDVHPMWKGPDGLLKRSISTDGRMTGLIETMRRKIKRP